MEWWYKSDRYPVNSQTMQQLQDSLSNELQKGNKLSIASLYDDEKFFYIKTTNNIYLHNFLFENGFEELYNGEPDIELNILYGTD